MCVCARFDDGHACSVTCCQINFAPFFASSVEPKEKHFSKKKYVSVRNNVYSNIFETENINYVNFARKFNKKMTV